MLPLRLSIDDLRYFRCGNQLVAVRLRRARADLGHSEFHRLIGIVYVLMIGNLNVIKQYGSKHDNFFFCKHPRVRGACHLNAAARFLRREFCLSSDILTISQQGSKQGDC